MELRKVVSWTLLCILAACRESTPETATQPAAQSPPPVTPAAVLVADEPMEAIQVTSRVVYPSAPDDPHTLQVTLADRGFARLKLASDPEVQGRRVLQHCWKGRLFVTSARSSNSEELPEPSARDSKAWFDLRRALCDWGLESGWESDSDQPSRLFLAQDTGPPMVATLDPILRRPSSIGFYDSEGRGLQQITHVEWSKDTPPPQPIAFHVENASGLVWSETDVTVRRGFQMRPEFFLPTDRRMQSQTLEAPR